MPYYVDGNNLIGLARGTGRPSEEDRDALVSELSDRLRRTTAKVIVFFDGPARRNSQLGNLSIRASGVGSADDAIVQEIQRARTPAEATVVTADRGLSARARSLGAKSVSPSEFWGRVGASARPRGSTAPTAPRVDVEEWTRYFEDEKNREKP